MANKKPKTEHLTPFEPEGEGLGRKNIKYATVGFDESELAQIEAKADELGISRAKLIRESPKQTLGI